MSSLELLLIRHGQTAWNVERRFLGRTDVPLDATGEAQAAALGRRFQGTRTDALYASPLSRALRTAATIGTPTPVEGLRELDMGELEGLSGSELNARYPGLMETWLGDPLNFRPPGGEGLAETRERAMQAMEDILSRHGPGERVVVVTHQIVIGTLFTWMLDRPLSAFREQFHVNTAVSTFSVSDGRFTLTSWNDASHLKT